MIEPYIYELAIVFVGDINPVIIQPYWLVNKGLIQETEGENAKVEVIHNEIVKFQLDWASVEITRHRLIIKTSKQPYFEIVKDLSASIFKILKDTPLKNLGINHILHFKFDNEKYNEIGRKLVPFGQWEGVLNNPRLLQLEMTDEPRNDEFQGHYRVKIAPSELIRPFGVSVNINDHFNKIEKSMDANEMVNTLGNAWRNSISRAKKTYTELWKRLEA
ncbi:MAG: hypothetical protein ACOCWM_04445 [Cyclobacteriaceae bacterium]